MKGVITSLLKIVNVDMMKGTIGSDLFVRNGAKMVQNFAYFRVSLKDGFVLALRKS